MTNKKNIFLLHPKKRLWVKYYVAHGFNATKAGKELGWKESYAQNMCGDMLNDELVQLALQEELEKLYKTTDLHVDKVVKELMIMAFSDMGSFITFKDGRAWLDWNNLPEHATRSIQEIYQEVELPRNDEDGEPIGNPILKTKIRLYDKRGPLNDLAKWLRMYADRTIELTGAGGGPIEIDTRDKTMEAIMGKMIQIVNQTQHKTELIEGTPAEILSRVPLPRKQLRKRLNEDVNGTK